MSILGLRVAPLLQPGIRIRFWRRFSFRAAKGPIVQYSFNDPELAVVDFEWVGRFKPSALPAAVLLMFASTPSAVLLMFSPCFEDIMTYKN